MEVVRSLRWLLPAFVIAIAAVVGGCATPVREGHDDPAARYEQGRQAWLNHDYETAMPALRAAARGGEPRAQYALGYMYFYGQGTPRDLDQAVQWIRLAAQQGDSRAIDALGRLASAGGKHTGDKTAAQSGSLPADLSGWKRVSPRKTRSAHEQHDPEGKQATAPRPGAGPHQPGDNPPLQLAIDDDPDVEPGPGMRWLAGRDPRHYTVELMAVRRRRTVKQYRERYLARAQAPAPVRVVAVRRRGSRWLLLLMGDYPDKAAAEDVIAGLPALLKAGKPKPQRFGAITPVVDTPEPARQG